MKLGEALSKLKKEKSKLARLIKLRKENLYVEEGKQTKFDPNKLSEEIDFQIEEIRKLKMEIQRTNLSVKVQGEDITIAEAIIKVNDIRSRIAHLSTLFDKDRYSYRSKDDIQKIPQIDEEKIENILEKLEIEKCQLDNKIQITNWTTKIIV